MKRLLILALLLWLCVVFYAGIFLFVSGFLLLRLEVNRTSSCEDILLPGHQQGAAFCQGTPRFQRAVLLIIDALKIDFARYDAANTEPRAYENKLPVLQEMMSSRPAHSRLYTFRADPPTTTMQRIKGFTTGSLPTFIDVGNNFASTAVLEDNIIQQLRRAGKRMVFMGDDTWENLFPKTFQRSLPFPSFNVKDLHTVDDGIIAHLTPTLMADDWDIVVAHFLGVDHCGHRFGPDHPAMAAKLSQMDGVIRDVVERLQEDTLLVVMGDHGMTDTGDHGGESQKETDSALFLYSPAPLFQDPPSQSEEQLVSQTDLVPSLALLLGVPVPYSSLGQVLLPLFPQHPQPAPASLSQLEALWVNAKQVHRFLQTYSSLATDIPASQLKELELQFSAVASSYLNSVGPPPAPGLPPPGLVRDLQAYLSAVRSTCRGSWARFDPLKMSAGLLVLLLACVSCLLLSEGAALLGGGLGAALGAGATAGLAVGLAGQGIQLLRQDVEGPWVVLAAAAISSEVVLLWRAAKGSGVVRLSPRDLLTPPLLLLLLRCASLLSDSYVISEGRVVTFLLLSLVLYVPLKLHWDGRLLPSPAHDPPKPHGLLPSPALSSGAVRREGGVVLACLLLLLLSLSASSSFHGCREEQASCQPSPFLSPLSRLQDGRRRNLHYGLALLSLGTMAGLLRRWLRCYGNLNAAGGAVLTAVWLLPAAALCLALFWAVGAAPAERSSSLGEMAGLAQVLLPRTAFLILGLGVALIWLHPLTVFVKSRGVVPTNTPPPRYRASTGMSPQAELHLLIPQLYQRMRRSLEAPGAGVEARPAVEAYGLGTVYSAPLLLLLGLLLLGLLLLHPEGLASAFLLLALEMGALLHLHASSTSLHRLQGEPPEGFAVSWTAVLLWALAAVQFFYATGHLPTFPSLQWGAAFVGFPEGHSGTMLPGILVTINTFSSHILFSVGVPLLLFWSLVCEVRRGQGGSEEDVVMEMRLRDHPQKFGSALLQLAARYLFINGVQLLSSAVAASLLRRHLMVWSVFAPKLMFEASGFLVSSALVLLGVALVMRVDVAVGSWFQRILPDTWR